MYIWMASTRHGTSTDTLTLSSRFCGFKTNFSRVETFLFLSNARTIVSLNNPSQKVQPLSSPSKRALGGYMHHTSAVTKKQL